ncbi:hypothetical protein Tco_0544917 [Tanacetum coccineum]
MSNDTVMSDSEDSTVTYIEEPEQAPPLPDFVPKLVYPEFMPPKDEVFPAEEQLLPVAVSRTADSPGYVPKSDSKEDPEEDPEEDPADYPADGGDDGDDEDESSDDDKDDDVDIEGDKEEEEHPAPTDSTHVALRAVDHAPYAEKTEPFETDESATTSPPHHAYRVTAKMSIRAETPISLPSREEVERLLALPSPPPSPVSPWSSPLPQIPSPPLLVSSPVPISPLPLLASPTYPLGYRAALIWLRAEAPSTSHPLPLPSPIVLPCTRASVAMMRATAPSTYILASQSKAPPFGTPPLLPILLPTPSPPLLLPSTEHRADSSSALIARPDGDFKRDYGFIATLDDEIMRDPERDVGYRITDTWDEMLVGMLGAPVTDETELGGSITVKDHIITGSRPQETDTVYRGLEIVEDTTNTVDDTLE